MYYQLYHIAEEDHQIKMSQFLHKLFAVISFNNLLIVKGLVESNEF